LPSGLELARQLGISRPSLRAAMARLAHEGSLVIAQGRRTRLTNRPAPTLTQPTVCAVFPYAASERILSEHPMLLEIHAYVASRGVHWEQAFDARLASKRPELRLELLTAGRRDVCWVLFRSTPEIQRWFVRAGLPVVVIGSCSPGISLPFVDRNYGAVGTHAAGRLGTLGHRHVAVIRSDRDLAGDLACVEAFKRQLRQQNPAATVTEIRTGTDPAELRRKLEWLLRPGARKTAFFSMWAVHALTTYTHLLRLGLALPRDVSVMSRDSGLIIDDGLPELTRYSAMSRSITKRAIRVIDTLLAGELGSPRPHLVTPVYVPGSTIGPPPAAAL
jgi:DNA-binding LacI/PurR family transcriptional regulator